MSPNFLLGILCGLAALAIGLWLLSDFIVYVYREGYQQGRKDACDWWCQAARDVEGMSKESKEEERWP